MESRWPHGLWEFDLSAEGFQIQITGQSISVGYFQIFVLTVKGRERHGFSKQVDS